MSRHAPTTTAAEELMSLAEAARAVGQPKAYLRELVAAGRLAVHLTGDPAAPKWRVDRASLEAAGLLPPPPRPPAASDAAIAELIALVKAQSERIATLEDQRFLLAAQLGATVERITAIEARPPLGPPAALPATLRQPVAALRRTVAQLGVAGVRHSTGLGARLRDARGRATDRIDEEPIA